MLGKCVLVFAGGTSHRHADFAGRADDEFVAAKEPDFASQLDGHLDVLGPNAREVAGAPDPKDLGVPLRRALLLRGLLGLRPDAPLEADPALVCALLQVRRYRHGSRSLEKLVQALTRGGGGALRRSDLPAMAQLAMHVDDREFLILLDPKKTEGAGPGDAAAVEVMAAAIHETWRALAAAEGWTMSPRFDKDYAELAEVDREDNRAAARRMPEVLALAGLALGAAPGLPEAEVAAQLDRNLERLAEAEHDGWLAQRARHGWRFAETRDDGAKLHPAMRPYAALSEQEKGKDRNAVRHYPRFATRAGLGIGWLG